MLLLSCQGRQKNEFEIVIKRWVKFKHVDIVEGQEKT